MIYLHKLDPWHTLQFLAFPQSDRNIRIMINLWDIIIILLSNLCYLWKSVAEKKNEQEILNKIKIWFQVISLLYFNIVISPCPPGSLFFLVHQCNDNVIPAVLPFHFWLLLQCRAASPAEEGHSYLPPRTELGTGTTGFATCCQICFYGSKVLCFFFFYIGLLTSNAGLLRASCNLFQSGFAPYVKPASLSPSFKVLFAFFYIYEALGNCTSGVQVAWTSQRCLVVWDADGVLLVFVIRQQPCLHLGVCTPWESMQ